MSIFYIRHGETIWNRDKRLQGQLDSPLTLRGVQLAIAYGEALKPELAGRDVSVVSSPLGRAWQTASIVSEVLGIDPDEIVLDPLLAEHDVGEFAGHVWSEIKSKFGVAPAEFHRWDFQPPGGESRATMFERAQLWLKNNAGVGTILLVSHGGFSRVLRGAYLGLGAGDTLALSTHDHGRYFRLSEGVAREVVIDDSAKIDEAKLG